MNVAPPREVTQAERRERLATRHRLLASQRTDDVAAIADSLVCLHSSDPATVFLSIVVRMVNPSIEAIECALYDDRSLLRFHAMRRTLWVSTRNVARHAYGSSTPKIAVAERRKLAKMLADTVDDPERWIEHAGATVMTTLATLGEASTRLIGEREPELRLPIVPASGRSIDAVQYAHVRVLLQLAFDATIIRARPSGSWANSQYPWTATSNWIPESIAGIDRAVAAAYLTDRWLRSFGPAPTSDLQWWTGWSRRDTERALEQCRALECSVDGTPAWLAHDDDRNDESDDRGVAAADRHWVALLPGLDPTTMGWKRRAWYLDSGHGADLFDRNGNAGPTIWVDGRVVGGWVQRPDGSITTEVSTDVDGAERSAIAERADMIERLVGDVRFKVRFPSPCSKRLYA